MQLGGGVGVIGVIIFLAIQLLGGGTSFDVPPGFNGTAQAPAGEPLPPGQEPGARKNFPVLPAKPAPDPRNSPDAPTEAVKQL